MSTAKWSKLLFAMMLALMLALVACSDDSDADADNNNNDEPNSTENDNNNNDNNDTNNNNDENDGEDEAFNNPEPDEDGNFDIDDFETAAGEGEGVDGGELTYALVSDTPFQGTLNYNFYSGAPDAEVIAWFDEALFEDDENFVYNDDGIASYEVDEDSNTVTVTLEEGVEWSDGEPLTVEDFAFAYKVLAHPDYDGQRYGSVLNVVGLEPDSDWHTQDTEENEDLQKVDTDEEIEGLKIVDDETIEVQFTELTPSTTAGGMWPYALPQHVFEDIPVAEMSESDAVRKNPVGLGPYVVDNIVAGESVSYVKNENYWRGEPALDKVTLKVVDPSNLPKALESGEVDMAEFPADQYPDYYEMSNMKYLGVVDLAYSYIGFKLGDWDKEEEKVNYKPDEMKMGDKDLRTAMWYAVDNDAVGEQFYHGLRWAGTTLVDPAHKKFHNEDIETPTYDPEKAKEILDDAGYVDTDDDGFREDPDGEELVINFASMSGGETAEPMAKYYMQAWEEVGLKVELIDGRLLEFNSFYERVGEEGDDDPEIDIYAGAWGTGSDIDPTGLYGEDVLFNFSRYHSEKNDELLEDGISQDAFDIEYRNDVYDEWQELMVDEVPVFPTLYRSAITAVNERVVNYDIAYDSDTYRYEIAVTEDEPVKAE